MSDRLDTAQNPSAERPPGAQGLVMRNAFLLVAAQIVGMPLSILVNAVMARYLGPVEFGYIYLAGTYTSLGFLLVDFGQLSALPALVARNRLRASELLGSGLAWRLGAAAAVSAVLTIATYLLDYGPSFHVALGLVLVGSTIATVTSAFQDTIRGFERADVAAYGLVGVQFLAAALIVPTLLLGGQLQAALTAQALAYAIVCLFVYGALRRMRLGRPSFKLKTLKELLGEGSPYLFMGLVLVLQPNVDALFLSQLGSPESMGWLAAARKLVGVLVFPAASLNSALFPTLCRLYGEDVDQYRRNVASALRTGTLLVIPVSLGCALYPDVGIRIFSREGFGPAEDDLRILALFVFLLYFSMILGTGIAAAGLQKKWALAQLACVAISAIVDPLLIPYFERTYGNGGLAVCISTVLSEILMVSIGLWLTPRGIFDRNLRRGLLLAVLAGGAMALVAWLLSGLNHLILAPISVIAYGACLWLTGGIDREQLEAIRSIVTRKAAKRA